MKNLIFVLVLGLLLQCEPPLATSFGDIEEAVLYESSEQTIFPDVIPSELKIMSWNVRFGAGRLPWFGDSCGDRVIMNADSVLARLDSIAAFIQRESPDILLLQEVDACSKRSAYIDQVQWILDNTDFNFAAYASMWKSQFVPKEGLGKIDVGNAVLSKWKITDAERIALALRTDQDPATKYFYLRRNLLKCQIAVPNLENFYAVNIHATAFATDDTKQKHIDQFESVLKSLNGMFIAGGDLNSIPPPPEDADSTYGDYCEIDDCGDEEFHTNPNGGPHIEGSYFRNFDDELDLLTPFYDAFFPAILLENLDESHFTHSTWNFEDNDKAHWDRKLDYLFSSDSLTSGTTHQTAWKFSDHAPVSAVLEVK